MTPEPMPPRKDFHCREFSAIDDLVRRKSAAGATVSVVIPARNEEGTVGSIVGAIRTLFAEQNAFVDEIMVIDDYSRDGTARVAREAGARVHALSGSFLPASCRGKGAALWWAQFVARGTHLVFIDADIERFDPLIIAGLAGPLLVDPEIYFVKARYRRPLIIDGHMFHDHGGRVTELLVKPLLHTLLPPLAGVGQPLGGEFAFRREALERLPFSTGYGVEIGLLMDFYVRFGLDHFAQVDIESRIHRNRPLRELSAEATEIARTLLLKLDQHGYLSLPQGSGVEGGKQGDAAGMSELAPRVDAAAKEREASHEHR